jgi:hypothetical protein
VPEWQSNQIITFEVDDLDSRRGLLARAPERQLKPFWRPESPDRVASITPFLLHRAAYFGSSIVRSSGGAPASYILEESKKPEAERCMRTSFLPLFCQNHP